MAKWIVAQWGNGSQYKKDLWNIMVPEYEALVVSDLPRIVADDIISAHNAEFEELEQQRDKYRQMACDLGFSHQEAWDRVAVVVNERDKALELLRRVECPNDCEDGVIRKSILHNAKAVSHYQVKCQWCDERKALLEGGE